MYRKYYEEIIEEKKQKQQQEIKNVAACNKSMKGLHKIKKLNTESSKYLALLKKYIFLRVTCYMLN